MTLEMRSDPSSDVRYYTLPSHISGKSLEFDRDQFNKRCVCFRAYLRLGVLKKEVRRTSIAEKSKLEHFPDVLSESSSKTVREIKESTLERPSHPFSESSSCDLQKWPSYNLQKTYPKGDITPFPHLHPQDSARCHPHFGRETRHICDWFPRHLCSNRKCFRKSSLPKVLFPVQIVAPANSR